jgi:hypothetical protein
MPAPTDYAGERVHKFAPRRNRCPCQGERGLRSVCPPPGNLVGWSHNAKCWGDYANWIAPLSEGEQGAGHDV